MIFASLPSFRLFETTVPPPFGRTCYIRTFKDLYHRISRFFQKKNATVRVHMRVCVCVFRRNCGWLGTTRVELYFFKRNRRGRRESLEDRRGVEAWSAGPWTDLTNRRPSRRRIRRGRASAGPVGNRLEGTPSFRTGQPRRTVAGPSSPIPTGTRRTTTGTKKKREKKKRERKRSVGKSESSVSFTSVSFNGLNRYRIQS